MDIQDDRTDAERGTHTVLIVGTDRFMSGWGKATGGTSLAAWACPPAIENAVFSWVLRRGDMSRVRPVCAEGYRPRGNGHLHIYAVREDHPAWPLGYSTENEG